MERETLISGETADALQGLRFHSSDESEGSERMEIAQQIFELLRETGVDLEDIREKTPDEVGEFLNGTRSRLESLLYLFEKSLLRSNCEAIMAQLGWTDQVSLESALCALQRSVESLGGFEVGKDRTDLDPDQFIADLFDRFDEASAALDDLPQPHAYMLSLNNVERLHELEVFKGEDLQKLSSVQQIYGTDGDFEYTPQPLERFENTRQFLRAVEDGTFDAELKIGIDAVLHQDPSEQYVIARGAVIECIRSLLPKRTTKSATDLMMLLSSVVADVAKKIIADQRKDETVFISPGELIVFRVLKRVLRRMNTFYGADDRDDQTYKKALQKKSHRRQFNQMMRDILETPPAEEPHDDIVPPELENPDNDEYEQDVPMGS